MKYQTRHLEATSEIPHGDKFLKPGDSFEASEVDAEQYIRQGKAKLAGSKAATPTKAAPAAAKTPAAKTPTPPAPPARTVAKTAAPATAAPATAAPAPAPESDSLTSWERTEPMRLADVPHPDLGTPKA